MSAYTAAGVLSSIVCLVLLGYGGYVADKAYKCKSGDSTCQKSRLSILAAAMLVVGLLCASSSMMALTHKTAAPAVNLNSYAEYM